MNDSDKNGFIALMNGISEYYGEKKPRSLDVIKLYFNSLISFDLDQVSSAINKHIESPDHGQFFPKIADFKRQLEGASVTPDMIIAAAKLKRSPLGILARIHIGTWNLNNLGSFDLRQHAIECQDLMESWKERAANGEYSDHELSIMVKHGVNPLSPLTIGIAGPTDKRALTARIERLTGNSRHEFLIGNDNEKPSDTESNPEQVNRIRAEIKKLLAKPKIEQPKPDMSEPK